VRLFGLKAWSHLVHETPLFAAYFHYFDRVLLDDGVDTTQEEWFRESGRQGVIRRCIEKVFAKSRASSPVPWGQQRRVKLQNLFLAEVLPNRFHPEYRSVVLEGSRGCLVQTALVRAFGQTIAIAPTYRSITDLGSASVESALAGGPSGRPWTRYYCSDLKRWRNHVYKVLSGV
jgi:hypothetical protein